MGLLLVNSAFVGTNFRVHVCLHMYDLYFQKKMIICYFEFTCMYVLVHFF